MRTADDLEDLLQRIDGRGYKAYRELRGGYDFGDLILFVDHVQGDPFAAPSRLRLRVPMSEAGFPTSLRSSRVRQIALRDRLARELRSAIQGGSAGRGSGSGKSGLIEVDAGGQEVLERSAVVLDAALDSHWVEARIEVGLPAAGRRVLGRAAHRILTERLPELARRALRWQALDQSEISTFVDCIEAQEAIRAQLQARGLIAFVADGSLLPRESGVSDRPMRSQDAVRFQSPESLAVEFELPSAVNVYGATRQRIRGMGIRRGVTLVVGGGYHGKSTLLHALERCVYPHIPGDGREWVVSDPALVKVRAEDGRSVQGVDIHGFIRDLPGPQADAARSTREFCSEDASGSTSQAAGIAEAVEAGARGLLLDEDTCATNFMVRDARMQALVNREGEPITPFLERVRELHDRLQVSTVLVMGGCGDYFEVADCVMMLRNYRASDATEEARLVAEAHPSSRRREAEHPLETPSARAPLAAGFDPSSGRRDVAIKARARDLIAYGNEQIDLRGLEQLVDRSQTRALAYAIHRASTAWADGERSLAWLLAALEQAMDESGLDPLDPFYRPGHHPGNLARPRRYEIAGAINRLRSLRVRRAEEGRGR